MSYSIRPDITKPKEEIVKQVNSLISLIKTPDDWGKLHFFKAWVDGGILTGTALMRVPYGQPAPCTARFSATPTRNSGGHYL